MGTEELILHEVRGLKTDIKEVHSRVSSLQKDTGEFKLRVERSLATIEQIETTCPIREVEAALREVEKKAEEARRESRRASALIATGIGGVWTAILAFFGWRNS